MGAITDSLTTITTALQGHLTGVEVEQHPGRFTEDELGKILRAKKAVRVAIEQLPKLEVSGDGIQAADVQFIAHIICSDQKGADRHQSALAIVEQLAGLIAYQRWDQPETFKAVAPGDVKAENLYSADLNGKGIAWWAVSWTQAIRN